MIDLAALAAAEQAATVGPWRTDLAAPAHPEACRIKYGESFIAARISTTADARLIVEARNALPDLIAVVRALQSGPPHTETLPGNVDFHHYDGACYECREPWPCQTAEALAPFEVPS